MIPSKINNWVSDTLEKHYEQLKDIALNSVEKNEHYKVSGEYTYEDPINRKKNVILFVEMNKINELVFRDEVLYKPSRDSVTVDITPFNEDFIKAAETTLKAITFSGEFGKKFIQVFESIVINDKIVK